MAEYEPEPERSRSNLSISVEHSAARPEVEPLPEWDIAVKVWGASWPIHTYGLGTVFLIVAVYSGIAIGKLVYKSDIRRRKVHFVNLFLLLMFGLSRSLFLIIDAYHSSQVLPVAVVKLLWGIGQPCIITAFVLVFIVLKNAFEMKQHFRSWYTTKNIALITLPYFLFVCIAEMTVSFIPVLSGLTFACQLLYVLFTIFLLVFYSFITFKIWKKKRDVDTSGGGRLKDQQSSKLKAVLLVLFAAIIGGILLCVSQIYAIVGIYGVFSKSKIVLPWPWYGFSTVQRVLEVYMCVLLCRMLTAKATGYSENRSRDVSTQNSSVVTSRQQGLVVTRQFHRNTAQSTPLGPTNLTINEI